MVFLVIGGTGFIGSNVVKGLVERSEEVIIFDAMPNINRLGNARHKVKVIRGDILDIEDVFYVTKTYNVDCIIHLAYSTDILGQEERPLKPIKTNCIGFNNVLEVARIMDIKRVVWASSVAVYGPPEYYSNQVVNEDAPTNPNTVYGACKVLDEYMGKHYYEKFGVDNIGLRPTVVYGPGRWFRGLSAFTYDLFVGPALGKPVKISFGNQKVNWMYVKDVAKAFLLACYVDKTEHKIFNIPGQVATIYEAAQIVQKLVPNAIVDVEAGEGRERWPAFLDVTRIEKELKYKQSYTLEKGFKEYIDTIRAEAKMFPHLYKDGNM